MPAAPSRFARAVVLAAALAGAALTARLGFWQWDRAAEKEALQAALDSRADLPALGAADLATVSSEGTDLLHRKLRLRGQWLSVHTVYLDNRQINARPGFIVVTPLQWAGGTVLVQRGWVPRDNNDRTRLPAFTTSAGEVEVSGRIAPPPARLYEFSAAASGPIRQNLDLGAFARETGLALLPVTVLQADGPEPDGLLRQWPRPAVDTQKNYGYALQWAALTVLITGLYVWHQLLRPRFGRRSN